MEKSNSGIPPSTERAAEGYEQSGVVIDYENVGNLIGKLLTYVDATFADREQREAHKSIVKDLVYKWYETAREWEGGTKIKFVYPDTNSLRKVPDYISWTNMDGTTYSGNDIKVTGGTLN